jgi:hypothetical protein
MEQELLMDAGYYLKLREIVHNRGFGEEYEWAQNLSLCSDPDEFWTQYAWVVISSGIKNQAALSIWTKVKDAIDRQIPVSTVFAHRGKAAAIDTGYRDRRRMLEGFTAAQDKLAHLETLPFIGGITKYHLARDLGLDVAKPDRHLVRIAAGYGMTTEAMCRKLSLETGDRVGAVDIVIWRAANLGLV